jgi:LysM repeat protein
MQNKSTVFLLTKIIILLFLFSEAFSQAITKPDSIIVFRDNNSNLLFEYKVGKGNTIYSISRFFKVDMVQIYGLNPMLQNSSLEVDSKIIIPFNIGLFSDYTNKSDIKKIGVYYRVGVKENLFRISRIYFHRSIRDLYTLNNLKDNNITPGQLLCVGNIYPESVSLTENSKNNEVSVEKNKQEQKNIVVEEDEPREYVKEKPVFVKKVVVEEEGKVEDISEVRDSSDMVEVKAVKIESNGLAIWNKKLNVNGVFVLNNEAKLYTLMELYNPLVNRKIVAKVIGRIPDNTYADNVKLILSPEAAKSLKAIDQRFFVKYKYLK